MLKKSHGLVRGLHGIEFSMEETWQTPVFSLDGSLNIIVRVPCSRGQMLEALARLPQAYDKKSYVCTRENGCLADT